MNFKQMLNETIKVNEEDLGAMKQVKFQETTEEQPTQASTTETENELVEVTPELVVELIAKMPELEGIDPAKLEVGMKVETEHLKSVSNDMEAIARIAADHIKEFPEADYYAALAAMEVSLVPPPVEEVPAGETPAAETEETPKEEMVPNEEEMEESKKKDKDDEGKKSKTKDKKTEDKEKKNNK